MPVALCGVAVVAGRASARASRFATSFLEGRRRRFGGSELELELELVGGVVLVMRERRAECLVWSFARLRGLLDIRW